MITGKQALSDRALWRRLPGAHFHSFSAGGKLQYQGMVLRIRKDGHSFDAQLFEWFMGTASDQIIVSRLELERFHFYGDSAEFMAAYRRLKREGLAA